MALPKQYLTAKHDKIGDYFETIFAGQAPEKFTITHLKNLGFTSSNDNLFIGILKSLGFLEDSGVPTQRYYNSLDQTQRRQEVALGIKDAYADLFKLDRNANEMDLESIKAKFKVLTEGKPSDTTLTCMAKTYFELCNYADWNIPKKTKDITPPVDIKVDTKSINPITNDGEEKRVNIGLKYDIHIHLPATHDSGVYDALFTSLKKHLID